MENKVAGREEGSDDRDEHHTSCAGNGFGVVNACLQCFGVKVKITERKAS